MTPSTNIAPEKPGWDTLPRCLSREDQLRSALKAIVDASNEEVAVPMRTYFDITEKIRAIALKALEVS